MKTFLFAGIILLLLCLIFIPCYFTFRRVNTLVEQELDKADTEKKQSPFTTKKLK